MDEDADYEQNAVDVSKTVHPLKEDSKYESYGILL